MARKKNLVPSLRLELNVRVERPIVDPRVQKAVDWVHEQNKRKKAAPMAWQLLVAAVNGELGSQVQTSFEKGDTDEALEALQDLFGVFAQ